MSAQYREKLMPTPTVKGQAYINDAQKYEGVKASIHGQIGLVQSCFAKCGTNFAADGLGANGDACMSQCYNKFFDASLLVHKELNLYTVALQTTV